MRDENTPLDGLEYESAAVSEPAAEPAEPPKRPEYTKAQRLMALGFAILVVIITLMYTYSIATGDLFFR